MKKIAFLVSAAWVSMFASAQTECANGSLDAIVIAQRVALDPKDTAKDSILSLLTEENYMDVLFAYEKMRQKGETVDSSFFFAHVIDPVSSCNSRYKSISQKAVAVSEWMLQYARQHDIYCENFAALFHMAVYFDQLNDMRIAMSYLFYRIYYHDTLTDSEYPINGKLDAPFYQVEGQDCWFLATLLALQNNPKGAVRLNNLLKVRPEEEMVVVTLRGKPYEISFKEIRESVELSRGDPDARCFEIAANRVSADFSIYASNSLERGPYILFGDDEVYTKKFKPDENYLLQLQKKDIISTIGVEKSKKTYWVRDMNNKKVSLRLHHAYAVVGIDKKYLYVLDPYTPTDTLRCRLKKVPKAFSCALTMKFRKKKI